MIGRLARKITTVIRYAFPGEADRVYLREIAREGAFDREFYLRAHPGLHPLFRLWPERHYVQHGERNGLSPNGRFSPRAYLHHNPDLEPTATRPLLHYLQTGRAENRTALLAAHPGGLPALPPPPGPRDAPAPVAVVLHLYYLDMWEEFAPLLAAQGFAFDLWVTLNGDAAEDNSPAHALRARIRAQFPQAQVSILPNHGRDIFPFLWLASGGALKPYAAVCKLHGKKSPHRDDGDVWRQDLTAGILGHPAITDQRLTAFLADDAAGFWVADGHRFEGDMHWGVNRDRAEALLARHGLALPEAPLRFPAGSIYWMRNTMLDRLMALDLGAGDFEPEQALVDGTTAHALERLFGSLAQGAGLEIRTSAELDRAGDWPTGGRSPI